MSTFYCPKCHSEIPYDDIHVSKDIAFCKSCGTQSTFSLISNQNTLKQFDFEQIPQGLKIEHTARGELILKYRSLSSVVWFLIPFTCLWSGISLFSIGSSILKGDHLDISLLFFSIPFLLGTIVLCSIIAFLLFGETRVSIQEQELRSFIGWGDWGKTWSYTLDKATKVYEDYTPITVNKRPKKGIYLENGSEHGYFGSTLSDEVRRYILHLIWKYQG